jgi:hypothetical protein
MLHNEAVKLGRNEPCYCGSTRKYKQCCLDQDAAAEREGPRATKRERVRITRDMFIGGPYKPCPSCGRGTFGVYIDTGGSTSYLRECTSCRHSEHRHLPAVRKTVVYLDQFVISNLTKLLDVSCRGHAAVTGEPFWMQLYERMELARDLQAIVFPDSDFHSDESFISEDPSYEALKDVYEHLSGGVSFYDAQTISRLQILSCFSTWLQGRPEPETLNAERVMHGTPHEWSGRIRIGVNMGRPFHNVEEMRARRKASHAQFASIFQEWQRSPQPINQTIANEARAFGRTAIRIYSNHVTREREAMTRHEADLAAGRRPDFALEDLFPPAHAALVRDLLREAQAHGLSPEEAQGAVLKFFESDSFMEIPSIKLSSFLFASIARKAAHGQKAVPSEGVFTDVEAIASLLPYCDAMVLDREMAGLLRDEPLRSAVARYGTRILSLSNRDEILDYLDAVVAAVSDEVRATVLDYMGEPGKPNMGVVEYGRNQRVRETRRGKA